MPDHIKFLLTHALFGALAAQCFVALLLVLNVANLQHLIFASPDGVIALIMLSVFFTITFGSVQIGRAVMALSSEDDDDDMGGLPVPKLALVPIEKDRS